MGLENKPGPAYAGRHMNKLDLYRNCAKVVQEHVSPEQALTRYVPGLDVRKDFVRCVFHHEDTASLHLGDRIAHCFGCGFSGDAIAIVMRLFSLNTHDALAKINEDFRLGMPITDRPSLRTRAQITQRADLIEKRRELSHDEEMERFEHKLDLEQQLYALQDIAEEFRPYDPEKPIHPLFAYAIAQIEVLNYRIDSEG